MVAQNLSNFRNKNGEEMLGATRGGRNRDGKIGLDTDGEIPVLGFLFSWDLFRHLCLYMYVYP